MLDDARLAGLCVRLLGERPAAVLFRAGHLSEVAGVQLADGTAAVIKIRPAASRIAGCTAVQAHLARAGFPCPAPLAGPTAAGDDLMVTAEALIPGGSQLPAAHGAAPYAGLLAWCIRSAPVVAQPEAAIVGLAAAVWPAGGGASHAAAVAQSADFIASYQAAAGCQWSEADVQAAWAAGLWVRLFNAKKDAAFGDFPELGQLAGEIDERLSLAAL